MPLIQTGFLLIFLARSALAKSEKRLSDIVENALIGICIVQDGQEVYRNPELRRLIADNRPGIAS